MTNFGASTVGQDVVSAYSEQVSGKTFVITGASIGGIGAHVAYCLAAAHPATVLLLGRNGAKVSPVVEKIQQISPSTKAQFVKVDLASSGSVRAAAAEVATVVTKIDVLVNNAGIMGPKFSLTPESVESQFGANHIGHFLLTNLLMPKLEAAGTGSRIVNVSSLLYQFSPVRFDDYNFSNGATFNTWEAYGQSKTANILFSVALAKKLASKGVRSYSLHPGNIQDTNLSSTVDPAEWPIVGAMFGEKNVEMPKAKTVEQGSATTLVAALDPKLDCVSGAFLDDCSPAKTLDFASSLENAEKLWALSEEIVGQKFTY
ncbi:related to retinol dehydrogenase 12 [Phialocephala subalpina]|uniref:Related to retinol dehydrogenase 12 n=1 Tax=Phialocephala subalpina TaxID=576137 RepID=A0A1L7XT84_9HELO|nr:related to retinol dehydrogenase 12 [Phialocephala subalpina]